MKNVLDFSFEGKKFNSKIKINFYPKRMLIIVGIGIALSAIYWFVRM